MFKGTVNYRAYIIRHTMSAEFSFSTSNRQNSSSLASRIGSPVFPNEWPGFSKGVTGLTINWKSEIHYDPSAKKTYFFGFLAISGLKFFILKTWRVFKYALELISRRFKSLHEKSLFILILHGDKVFVLIVYSWPLAGEVTWPRWQYIIETKTTFRKARQIQSYPIEKKT